MARQDEIIETLPNYDADNAQMPNEISGLGASENTGSAATAPATGVSGRPAAGQGTGPSGQGGRRGLSLRTGVLLMLGWLALRGLKRRNRFA